MEVIVINIPVRRANIAKIAQNVRQTMTNLKNSENNHGHTETSYKRLLELSPIGIFILDMKGVIRFCNPAAYQEGGYSEEEFFGKHFSEVVSAHGGDKASYNKIFKSIKNGEVPKPFEFTYKRKDNTRGYAEIHASLLDEEDIKLGLLVYKIDINERKRVEEALREERDKANMYLDIAGVILLVLDSDQIVKHINRKGCEALEYSEDEIKGKNWFDNFIPPRLRRDVGDVYKQLMSGKIKPVEYYENPILTKNGEEKIIAWHNTVLKDRHGNIIGTLSSGEDITERRKAEEASLESEEKYRDLIDNTNELIQSVTPDGHFRYVNNGWRQALGYSEDEVSDLTIFDIIHPDYLQHCQMLFQRVMSGEDVGWIETGFISKNGSKIIVEGSVTCRFANGKPMHTRGIFRDITKSKFMEEQMTRLSSAISMSTDCIVITDFNAKIIDVNQKTLELYGADSGDELIGRHFLEIIAPAERAMVSIDVKDIIEKGYIECREYNMISKQGREFPVQMSTSLVRAADGKPMGMVRVGRKLSEIN